MAVQRMRDAEEQLRQVEDSARQTLPTMHGELNELRRALKLQEDAQARTRSELEAARLAHQGIRQASSSMPMSSRTTDSGWEYMSRDRVQAFPIGADIRSPEVRTPSHRSWSLEKCSTLQGPRNQHLLWSQKRQRLSVLRLALRIKHTSVLRSVQHRQLRQQRRTSRRQMTQEQYVTDNFVIYSRHSV